MNGAKLCLGNYAARRSGVTAGAALILTLACIVILTALVLLFLSHSLLETQVSVASADQTASALFARGAVDSVIGELKQEITAGSVATFSPGGSDVRDPNTVFLPATNQAMVPSRMDSGAPANVLKRSAWNEPFFPTNSFYNTASWPSPQWAVNFSSTNPGSSGRYVSMQRWNEPLLMPTASSTSTNITPASGFIPPDWIYLTRTQGPATTWNPNLIPNTASGALNGNCVVGRYAYVVYDEGGLLDANAAGYSTDDGVTATMMRHKISEACADLTQIGLANSDIDALIAWRNPVSGASVQAYTNYVYNPNTNAFLTPATGDRIFTSRQQLIAFLTQDVANSNASAIERMQGALPYLTTFSRELNAPSWYPQTNMASSAYSYYNLSTNTASYGLATNATASVTNIFAPLERSGSMYTNLSGLVSNPNQPVAFSRFPLSRLSWITPTGAATGITSSQIQNSFGLVWDSANTAWIYAGPSGSSVVSAILPLSEIRGREPNFFELLKAGILSGSVGEAPSPYGGVFPGSGDVDSRYSQYDQQVMQIGINAIDQASVSPLPTRVEFGSTSGKNTTGDSLALYGTKSLPYIYKMIFAPYRPQTSQSDGYTNNGYYTAWIEPVFWDPYTNSSPSTSALNVRIRGDSTDTPGAFGQFGTSLDSQQANFAVTLSPQVTCEGPTNSSAIVLNCTSAAAIDNAASSPIMLNTLLTSGVLTSQPNVSVTDARANSSVNANWPGGPANADIYTEGSTTYAGFWLGSSYLPNPPDPNITPPIKTGAPYDHAIFFNGLRSNRTDHSFVLEADYGGGNFQEVQRFEYKYFTGEGYVAEGLDLFSILGRRLEFYTVNDPRTGRFSLDLLHPASYTGHETTAELTVTAADNAALTLTTFANSANYWTTLIKDPVVTGTSMTVQPSASGVQTPSGDTFRFDDNSSTSSGTTTPFYSDTDGAQRPGDGWWSGASANTLPSRLDTPQDRPVLLGRPFYSVGELGYVDRDMPWRSLDLGTRASADSGVLDYFCINDGYAGSTNSPVVAGVLNLNTAKPPVLQAMLNGAARAEYYPGNDISATDAANISTAITNVTQNVPLLNKSEMATLLAPADPTVSSGTTDSEIKERREALVRALSNASQVRTWNLMIDVVAQTGHFPPGATGFTNFLVTAEQRYWAHVAIDRYTGQVVSLQLEPVSE